MLHGVRSAYSSEVAASERQLCEQSDEVDVRFDAVCFACLDEGVQVGVDQCAGDRIGEQPALAADDERPYRVLSRVVSKSAS